MANVILARIFGSTWINSMLDGFSTTILSSINQKYGNCIGIEWDGANLWETNYTDDTLFKHAGWVSAYTSEGAMPGTNTQALTCNNTRLFSQDNGTGLVYLHVGFTNSVDSSFAFNVRALTHDGANLISGYSSTVNFHSGETGDIVDSYLVPDGSYVSRGVGWDGTNVLIGANNHNVYRMVGKTSSVDVSYSTITIWPSFPYGYAGSITLDDIDVRLSVTEISGLFIPQLIFM